MPTFEIKAQGDRDETITLEMPSIGLLIEVISAFWTDAIFVNEGGSPFTYVTIQRDGRTVAYGWLERAGWMWEDIDES
jgi:hypothetical protein